MKIAVAGKGGVGKTTIAAWMGDYLVRRGKTVWMVDADTTLSLGQACGLPRSQMPEPLIKRTDLLRERIRPDLGSIMHLNPDVGGLPETLSVALPMEGVAFDDEHIGKKYLLVMGAIASAGGGCACDGNALLKALLAHLVLEREEWVIVDMEAGVEHLGRGTVAHVDHLLIVSEPSRRSLEAAAEIGEMGKSLGLLHQTLVLNQSSLEKAEKLPKLPGLPMHCMTLPALEALKKRQWFLPSVLNLDEQSNKTIDDFFNKLFTYVTDGHLIA